MKGLASGIVSGETTNVVVAVKMLKGQLTCICKCLWLQIQIINIIFTQFVLHCSTIKRVLSLFLDLILIIPHNNFCKLLFPLL